jgi:dTDP-4-dehydrorhamnose 3,5-epimerase
VESKIIDKLATCRIQRNPPRAGSCGQGVALPSRLPSTSVVALPRWGSGSGSKSQLDNKNQVWAQYGFTPGFCSLTDDSEVQYKCTAAYNPQGESGIHFADPEIGIRWPIEPSARYLTSDKDRRAQTLAHWLQSPLSANIACQTEVSKKP